MVYGCGFSNATYHFFKWNVHTLSQVNLILLLDYKNRTVKNQKTEYPFKNKKWTINNILLKGGVQHFSVTHSGPCSPLLFSSKVLYNSFMILLAFVKHFNHIATSWWNKIRSKSHANCVDIKNIKFYCFYRCILKLLVKQEKQVNCKK